MYQINHAWEIHKTGWFKVAKSSRFQVDPVLASPEQVRAELHAAGGAVLLPAQAEGDRRDRVRPGPHLRQRELPGESHHRSTSLIFKSSQVAPVKTEKHVWCLALAPHFRIRVNVK